MVGSRDAIDWMPLELDTGYVILKISELFLNLQFLVTNFANRCDDEFGCCPSVYGDALGLYKNSL